MVYLEWKTLSSNVEKTLDQLGLSLSYSSGRFFGSCPVHGGDNPTAFSIYEETGYWCCFTHHCEQGHGNTLRDLVKALGGKFEPPKIEQQEFFNKIKKEQYATVIPRSVVKKRLQIPSNYYIERGFTPEILEKYDVGYAGSPGTQMTGRHVIPVYDIDHEFCLGCSGRLNTNDHAMRWRHTKGFPSSKILYNAWYAKNHIEWGGKIIITEGPAKVWRLEESGIGFSVAIFGTELGFEQKMQLAKLGVNTIILMMDGDDAGEKAARKIRDELKDLYRVCIPKTDIEDLDRTPVEQVRETWRKINADYSNWWG